jgi:hypothetical protein
VQACVQSFFLTNEVCHDIVQNATTIRNLGTRNQWGLVAGERYLYIENR